MKHTNGIVKALALEIAFVWFGVETPTFADLRHKYPPDELIQALNLLQRCVNQAKHDIKNTP